MLDCPTLLTTSRLPLMRFAFSLLDSWEDAEDAAQETAIRAWRAWPSLVCADDRAAHAWLWRIARNICLDMLRKRAVRPQSAGTITPLMPGSADVERDVCARETLRAVDAIAGTLDALHRDALMLMAAGYRRSEIAVLLGVPSGTAASATHRARDMIRATLRYAA